ncbi:BMC domain-containing protein [Virgibacillus oceani]
MEALGLIENKSYLSSIVVADTALKAADVKLIDVEIIKGGYVTVQLVGDVAAVKAAVEAGAESVRSFGTLISSHVIPRMHMETHQLIEKSPRHQSDQDASEQDHAPAEPKKLPEEQAEDEKEHSVSETDREIVDLAESQDADHKEEATPSHASDQVQEAPVPSREDLEKMTVGKLRQLVRERKAMDDNTRNIKYARKAELVSSLIEDEALYDNDVKG